jgi:parallel beta-helix repeat protein
MAIIPMQAVAQLQAQLQDKQTAFCGGQLVNIIKKIATVVILLLLLVGVADAQNRTVTIQPSSATIDAGATIQLTALGDGRPVTNVSWAIDDPLVANVNARGLVTGNREGTARIYVTWKGVTSAPAVITVTGSLPPPPGADLSVSPTAIGVGGTVAVSFSLPSPGSYDWIALAVTGSEATQYLEWKYASSCTTSQGTPRTSGTCSWVAPATAGNYEFRLFPSSDWTPLDVAPLTVTGDTPPPTEICGDGIDNDGDGLVDEDCTPMGRGPSSAIVCSVTATVISPGQPINTTLNAQPEGAEICFAAGTHQVLGPIRPKAGQQLIGQHGAVLNGTQINFADGDGTSIISGWNCSNCAGVTVRNLTIVGRDLVNCVGAYGPNAGSWVVDHNEISGCRWGVNFGMYWAGTWDNKVRVAGPTISNNYIHRNVWSGSTGSDGSGAYGFQNTDGARFVNNEVAFNGSEPKWTGTINTYVADNFFHHNGVGIWFDGDNLNALIERNISEDNTGEGLFYEISASGIIRDNTFRRNQHAGVFISTSHEVEVYNNRFEDNWRDINLFVNCDVVKPAGYHYPTSIEWDLRNVNIHDNVIYVGTRAETMAVSWSPGSSGLPCTAEQLAYYSDVSRSNNRLSNNTYYLPFTNTWWFWNGWKSWSDWQALGQDLTSTILQR